MTYVSYSPIYPSYSSGDFINYQPTYTSGGFVSAEDLTINWPGLEAVQPPQPQGSSVNSRVGTVQVKAGFVGQVYVNDPLSGAKVILWESKPKKTLSKADKAAKKAQVRAAKRSFE